MMEDVGRFHRLEADGPSTDKAERTKVGEDASEIEAAWSKVIVRGRQFE